MDEAIFGGLAFMDEAVEQGGGHLGVPEHAGPLAEVEVVATTIEVRS